MPDSKTKISGFVPDATGSWRPADPSPLPAGDPPTVRTGGKVEGDSESSFGRRAEALPLPRAGDRIESFELVRAIGIGGMGAVYLAVDGRLQREVALKILPPEQSSDGEVVQRFYQEGRAAARLDHENIARVFTIGTDKGYHFIAFEYIEGTTLRQRVAEKGPLRVDEAINYTLQVAGALVHASERSVVHRDIKPSNIIVTPQGRAKLVDMGLARRFERGTEDDGLTQSGMTLGTFDYISPEQARDPRDVDVRGDLYSLGCTLFHMLTGRPPFPEGTVLQKLLQHQEEPPPDVRSVNPSVPEDLAAILLKLMAKDRDRRYQTPELLVRDLLTVAGSMGLRSLSPEGLVWMAPPSPPAWERHLVWGVPAAALALVVGSLVIWGQPGVEPFEPPPVEPMVATSPKPSTLKPAEPKPSPVVETVPKAATAKAAEAAPPRPRARPREVALKPTDDLAAALAREPSGSTLILTEDGPYELKAAPPPATGRRDLTIRAGADARPTIRGVRGGSPSSTDSAILRFGPGVVAIEGIEFRVGDADSPASAIRAEGTELTIRRCLFRTAPLRLGPSRPTAVELGPGPADAPPTTLMVDASHVDRGAVGVRAKGAADVQVRDSTFGADGPSFLIEGPGGSPRPRST